MPTHPLPPSRPRHARRSAAAAPVRRSVGSRILGGVGELFITLGVLGILFLVWELWWTGLEADRERNEATQELFSNIEALENPGDSNGDGDGNGNGGDGGDGEESRGGVELEDLVVPGPDHTANFADQGGVMAMVYAPRLGADWAAPVVPGVGPESLNRAGLGHYSSTQLPGEPGNFALAGHRQTYGNILWNQDKFAVGDLIYVQSPDGWYIYSVTETYIVQPNQSDVLAPVPGDLEAEAEGSTLTLTTCHPPYTTLERMITHAELVDYAPLSDGPPSAVADTVERQMQADGPFGDLSSQEAR
ncbi:class E sortase [Nesterenkonia sp. CL21]|uniref:class E sortase n=1 Tax=Nesterenkonia sp. CL21 TaxID=3064894 RepID=UPI00287AE624|nr:class E sortase [Nesterenkonia sp. CL21]MDS2174237.1 class E sortase [Nesterenkonia sp. CL21]